MWTWDTTVDHSSAAIRLPHAVPGVWTRKAVHSPRTLQGPKIGEFPQGGRGKSVMNAATGLPTLPARHVIVDEGS